MATTPDRPEAIAYTRCALPTAFGLAIETGAAEKAFAELGIGLVSLRHSSEPVTRSSHFSHKVANSFRFGGNTPAIHTRSRGADTVLIGLQRLVQYRAIITLRDSPIREVTDLRGKRVALPRLPGTEVDVGRLYALETYLDAFRLHGVAEDSVEFVDTLALFHAFEDPGYKENTPRVTRIHTPELIALVRGEVDAIVAFGAQGVELREQLNAVEIINLNKTNDLIARRNNEQPLAVTVSGSLYRDHPGIVARYLETVAEVTAWSRTNLDAARRIFAREMGTAEFWLDEGAPHTRVGLDPVGFDEEALAAVIQRKDLMLARGLLGGDVDFDQWRSAPLAAAA